MNRYNFRRKTGILIGFGIEKTEQEDFILISFYDIDNHYVVCIEPEIDYNTDAMKLILGRQIRGVHFAESIIWAFSKSQKNIKELKQQAKDKFTNANFKWVI